MAAEIRSANFTFMRAHDVQFDNLGALAERYFRDDPNTCLIKLRQFGELVAQEVAARIGLYTSGEEPQSDLLRRLRAERAVAPAAMELFHQIRIAGNEATHAHADDHSPRGCAEADVPFGSTVLFRRRGPGGLGSRSYARSEWRWPRLRCPLTNRFRAAAARRRQC